MPVLNQCIHIDDISEYTQLYCLQQRLESKHSLHFSSHNADTGSFSST